MHCCVPGLPHQRGLPRPLTKQSHVSLRRRRRCHRPGRCGPALLAFERCRQLVQPVVRRRQLTDVSRPSTGSSSSRRTAPATASKEPRMSKGSAVTKTRRLAERFSTTAAPRPDARASRTGRTRPPRCAPRPQTTNSKRTRRTAGRVQRSADSSQSQLAPLEVDLPRVRRAAGTVIPASLMGHDANEEPLELA